MPKYLIAISVGPVQDFIGAARRTRDLWFGSEVLSRISKSIARQLNESGAELIFPAPSNAEIDLEDKSSFNVGNKLLVLCATDNPSQQVAKLKVNAQAHWKNIAQEVKEKAFGIIKNNPFIEDNIWEAQLTDVLEIFCAWVEITEENKYPYYRKRVDELLASRKNTREFNQAAVDGWGRPKSSLDGLRESVLKKSLKKWERMKLGLSNSEQLDCPGLVKRLGGLEREQFTPISRIAIDPWLRGIGINKSRELSEIGESLEPLIKHGLVSRVTGNAGIYSIFPYDGQILYPFRLDAVEAEVKRVNKDDREQSEKILSLIRNVKNVIKKSGVRSFGEPLPYVAVIHADGDRMGELLNDKKTIEEHRKVSAQLTAFASNVTEIVRGCRGDTIYSGGDDVLALLPLDKVIECAYKLQDKFKTLVESSENVEATLSVGIAVGHLLEPMGKLLELSRYAETLAKGNNLKETDRKNGLAIVLKPRSGAAIEIRSQWDSDPQYFLQSWITAHVNCEIPDGAAYQLRELAKDLSWVDDGNENDKELVKLETLRILKRKKSNFGQTELTQEITQMIEQRIESVGLKGLAEELILTRRFAEVKMQAELK